MNNINYRCDYCFSSYSSKAIFENHSVICKLENQTLCEALGGNDINNENYIPTVKDLFIIIKKYVVETDKLKERVKYLETALQCKLKESSKKSIKRYDEELKNIIPSTQYGYWKETFEDVITLDTVLSLETKNPAKIMASLIKTVLNNNKSNCITSPFYVFKTGINEQDNITSTSSTTKMQPIKKTIYIYEYGSWHIFTDEQFIKFIYDIFKIMRKVYIQYFNDFKDEILKKEESYKSYTKIISVFSGIAYTQAFLNIIKNEL